MGDRATFDVLFYLTISWIIVSVHPPPLSAGEGGLNLLPNFQKEGALQDLKGYLCYKTITSQNVSSETQVKNFFIL